MARKLFLTEYVKNFREVGAVAPSSRYLARKMCQPIDFKNARLIVEYGPGTGVFSRELVRHMEPGAKLLLIESNPAFYDRLTREFSTEEFVIVEKGSAEHVTVLLTKHALPAPDVVVSGLPFAALPSDMSHKILRSTAKLLGTKGKFVTFQYTLLKKELIGSYFRRIELTRELRNLPPAYILTCTNK